MCVSTSALVNVGFIGTGIEPPIPPDPACCAVNSVEQRACISISPRFLLNVCVCVFVFCSHKSQSLFVCIYMWTSCYLTATWLPRTPVTPEKDCFCVFVKVYSAYQVLVSACLAPSPTVSSFMNTLLLSQWSVCM